MQRVSSTNYHLTFRKAVSQPVVDALRADPVPDSPRTIAVAIRDQADLQGLLRRIEDLGLELVALNPASPEALEFPLNGGGTSEESR